MTGERLGTAMARIRPLPRCRLPPPHCPSSQCHLGFADVFRNRPRPWTLGTWISFVSKTGNKSNDVVCTFSVTNSVCLKNLSWICRLQCSVAVFMGPGSTSPLPCPTVPFLTSWASKPCRVWCQPPGEGLCLDCSVHLSLDSILQIQLRRDSPCLCLGSWHRTAKGLQFALWTRQE